MSNTLYKYTIEYPEPFPICHRDHLFLDAQNSGIDSNEKIRMLDMAMQGLDYLDIVDTIEATAKKLGLILQDGAEETGENIPGIRTFYRNGAVTHYHYNKGEPHNFLGMARTYSVKQDKNEVRDYADKAIDKFPHSETVGATALDLFRDCYRKNPASPIANNNGAHKNTIIKAYKY